MRTLTVLMLLWCLTAGCSGGSDSIVGVTSVDSIEIVILDGFPGQVMIIARGGLPDSCSEIGSITQRREGNTFMVTIETLRNPDQICAQVIVPFQESISLDIEGLPSDKYFVDVNSVRDSFVLDHQSQTGDL
ncbi:hypothetical protein N9903_01260 [bacterium]|nr:hypothetical protein [bacterium]